MRKDVFKARGNVGLAKQSKEPERKNQKWQATKWFWSFKKHALSYLHNQYNTKVMKHNWT